MGATRKNIQRALKEALREELLRIKAVTFCFDDGWIQTIDNALPILRDEYNFRAVAAVPSDVIGASGYLTAGALGSLVREGWEIASHSKTHPADIRTLRDDQLEDEFRTSRDVIAETEGTTEPVSFIPPGNIVDRRTLVFTKKYYLLSTVGGGGGYTLTYGINDLLTQWNLNRVLLDSTAPGNLKPTVLAPPLLDRVKRSGGWLIFYTHRVRTPPGTGDITEDDLRAICDMIKERNLLVVTLREMIPLLPKPTRLEPYQHKVADGYETTNAWSDIHVCSMRGYRSASVMIKNVHSSNDIDYNICVSISGVPGTYKVISGPATLSAGGIINYSLPGYYDFVLMQFKSTVADTPGTVDAWFTAW